MYRANCLKHHLYLIPPQSARDYFPTFLPQNTMNFHLNPFSHSSRYPDDSAFKWFFEYAELWIFPGSKLSHLYGLIMGLLLYIGYFVYG